MHYSFSCLFFLLRSFCSWLRRFRNLLSFNQFALLLFTLLLLDRQLCGRLLVFFSMQHLFFSNYRTSDQFLTWKHSSIDNWSLWTSCTGIPNRRPFLSGWHFLNLFFILDMFFIIFFKFLLAQYGWSLKETFGECVILPLDPFGFSLLKW